MRRTDDTPQQTSTSHSDPKISRRAALAGAAAAAATVGLAGAGPLHAALDEPKDVTAQPAVKRGRLKQSLCHWCMGMSLEDLCKVAVELGVPSIEILKPDSFATLKQHGLICAMTQLEGPAVISKGLNRIEHHESYLARMRSAIDATSEAGFPNVICFSGNRDGMPDDEGLENCAKGLEQIVGYAEQKKVTICMELLNSKEHKDYMCDHTEWGAKLVDRVGSDRFKLLYDIYHMQRMEGDVIPTIRAQKDRIGHYHTAGNPGRSNLDETQELQYAPICKAIVETGYQGYLGQEFYPKGGVAAIREAVALCDV